MSDQSETLSLDTMLDGPADPAATTPTETGVKPQDAEPPAESDESDDSPLVPRKALLEERRKRQDYEKKMGEFEARLAELSRPQPPPQQQRQEPQPPPDPWTDPEAAMAYQRREQAMDLYETRVILSEELMSQKPDYNEAKSVFLQAAHADPALAQKLVRHPMPAKFVYEEGKRLAALREIGPDPAAYRDSLRQQLMEELRAEMGGHPSPVSQAPKAPAPRSLAGTTSAQPRDPKNGRWQPGGPASLEDLLG